MGDRTTGWKFCYDIELGQRRRAARRHSRQERKPRLRCFQTIGRGQQVFQSKISDSSSGRFSPKITNHQRRDSRNTTSAERDLHISLFDPISARDRHANWRCSRNGSNAFDVSASNSRQYFTFRSPGRSCTPDSTFISESQNPFESSWNEIYNEHT